MDVNPRPASKPSFHVCRGGPRYHYVMLSRRSFLSLSATIATAAPTRPPNFVLIFIDDMGYADIEPFGSKVNRTPNLNRMAAEGMKLTSFYAAALCTPSRAALMTGCYPKRVGLAQGSWHGVLMPGDENGINAKEVTVASLLKKRGYATACIGKWHLGDQPEFLPTRHGFDYFFGLPYSNDMNPTYAGARLHPPLPLLHNESVLQEVRDQSFLTGAYTREAVKFIHDNRNKPFFLYLPHAMMHVPLFAGEDFRGKSPNGLIGDVVAELDWSVGRLLDVLNELKLAENTFVLFTSDNGAASGVATPLRGKKASAFEGGLREPAIAWWPGTIAPGSVSDEIVTTMDMLPTFAMLAGTTAPRDRIIDGLGVMAVLKGGKSPRKHFLYYQGTILRAVRTGEWKLFASGELYNLNADIGEKINVADANPAVVKRHEGYLAEARLDLGDGPEYPGKNCRPVGKAKGPLRFLIPRPGLTGEAAHAPVSRAGVKLQER